MRHPSNASIDELHRIPAQAGIIFARRAFWASTKFIDDQPLAALWKPSLPSETEIDCEVLTISTNSQKQQ